MMRGSFVVALLLSVACQDYSVSRIPDDIKEVPPEETDLLVDTDAATETDADSDVPEDTESDPPAEVDTDTPAETDVPVDTDPPAPIDPIPVATLPVYAHTRDTLYTVDPVTGATSRIGPFIANGVTLDDMVDIAIDLSGRVYGGTQGESDGDGRAIWRIDPTSGAATHICDTMVKMYALTFLSDGRLVAGDGGRLQTLDLTQSCRVATIAESEDWETSGDVVALPDGLIYWTVRGDPLDLDEDLLVVVDPATGRSRLNGPINDGRLEFSSLYGLGYDEDEDALYGFSSDGDIVQIDPFDGHARLMASTPLTPWWGATTNPVLWGP